MLETSREVEGYDGTRGRLKWWFEAWGTGSKDEWTTRDAAGRPPTPRELIDADYIVIGLQRGKNVYYRTKVGGMDFRKAPKRKPRKKK